MCDSPRLSDYGTPAQCLGQGAFGSVYLYKQPQRRVAIKKISLPEDRYACMYADPENVDEEYEESLASLINEATAYAYLESEYILKPHAIACAGLQMGIVMPLAVEDLTQRLSNSEIKINSDEARNILSQVGRGLFDAHMQNILNLDIKPCNILHMPDGRIKLTDWGKAQLEFCSHPHIAHWDAGTINYNPPEKLLDFTERTPAFDVWSFGILIYTVHTKKYLFLGDSTEEVLQSMIRELGNLPLDMRTQYKSLYPKLNTPRMRSKKLSELEPELSDLLRQIFVFTPNKRPSMYEVLQHPYFKSCPAVQDLVLIPRPIRLANRIAPGVDMPTKEMFDLRKKLLLKLVQFGIEQEIESETIHLAINLYDQIQARPLIEIELEYILVATLYLAETLTSAIASEVTTYRHLLRTSKINVPRVFALAIEIGQNLTWHLAPTTCFHWFEFFKFSHPNELEREQLKELLLWLNLTVLPFKYTSLDIVLTVIAWLRNKNGEELIYTPAFEIELIDKELASLYHIVQKSNTKWPKVLYFCINSVRENDSNCT